MRTPARLAALGLLAVCGVTASGADPVLIPPAPAPGPTTPGYLNPVPGGVTTPVAPPTSGNPGAYVPGPSLPEVCPPIVSPPIVCPNPSVVWWYGGDYSFGLGYWHAPSVPGYRIGYTGETLAETSRRLDPQALPAMNTAEAVPMSPQREAVGLLRAGRYDLAAGALGVLVAHARDAAAGVLEVPPGSAATGAPSAGPGRRAADTAEATWSVGESQRLLALALLGQKLDAHAVRALNEAYAAEQALCERPLSADMLGGPSELRRLMLRSVTHAQKVGTPEAWFLAAAMMQAQGRSELPEAVRKGMASHPLAQRLAAWRPGGPTGPAARTGTLTP